MLSKRDAKELRKFIYIEKEYRRIIKEMRELLDDVKRSKAKIDKELKLKGEWEKMRVGIIENITEITKILRRTKENIKRIGGKIAVLKQRDKE